MSTFLLKGLYGFINILNRIFGDSEQVPVVSAPVRITENEFVTMILADAYHNRHGGVSEGSNENEQWKINITGYYKITHGDTVIYVSLNSAFRRLKYNKVGNVPVAIVKQNPFRIERTTLLYLPQKFSLPQIKLEYIPEEQLDWIIVHSLTS